MLVQEFLERTADRLPDKVALAADGRRLTYAEIEAQANRLANGLTAHGLQRGDRVIIFLPNCVEAVLAIFAVLKACGVFVVVNPSTKSDKLIRIANDCQTRMIVLPGNQAAATNSLFAEIPSLQTAILVGRQTGQTQGSKVLEWNALLEQCPADRPPHRNTERDLACLIYTSGSTGDPKGVMSDHGNIDFVSSSIITYLENTQVDVVIGLLPVSFDYGLYQVLMTFKFGGRLVLEKGFLFPAYILKRIEQEQVTGFPGVPTIFSVLLQMDLSGFDLSSIRYITNTAAALPVQQIQAVRRLFPQVKVYSMYGLTETKRTLYLPPDELDCRPGSVGIAIPGTEAWLEDEDGNRLPNGSTGELVVRGRHVMQGYWNDPDLSALRYRGAENPADRICKTGDLFRTDADGFFYFVARKDDIIKSRGEKVPPVEVERILCEMEGVMEAAVIGVPDETLGQAIKAFVVASGTDLDAAAVIRHCRARLEDFMVPKYVEFRDALPKTSSGKIQKKDLR